MSTVEKTSCIGRYCGYKPVEDGWDLESCGACPRGFRSNETKYCIKCEDSPSSYEWNFLSFMIILPCMMNWIFILQSRGTIKLLAMQMIISTCESLIAGVFALLSTEPLGVLNIVSCGVERLSDWYPMFYNPQIQYTETIHCTQEVVYPLLTTVCIYYAYLLCFMIIFRPILMRIFSPPKKWQDPIYAALYSLPILVVTQAVCGGLIYYAYPYIAIIMSLLTVTVYFVWAEITSLRRMGENMVRNLLIVLWHIAVIGFGIISLQNNFFYLILVVVPVLFYFMTVSFTDPMNIDAELSYQQ